MKEDKREFYCCRCERKFKRQLGNFPASQSPLFSANNHFLPVCRHCIDELFDHYTRVLGSEEAAIRRVCMKFDIYFDDSLCEASRKISAGRSRIHTYVSRANLRQYAKKTYDDTLDAENGLAVESLDDLKENKAAKVTQKTVKFFGFGFSEDEYKVLQDQYDDWISRHECKTKAQEELFKNLCINQLMMQKAAQGGGRIDNLMDTFQKLLGSANIKPTQTSENVLAEANSFGMLIKKWEDEDPIPEPEPQWRDVDGIRHYINVWFLGHLCKMMGIKNTYSKEYEKELARSRVEKPEYVGDEEEISGLDDMFGDGA